VLENDHDSSVSKHVAAFAKQDISFLIGTVCVSLFYWLVSYETRLMSGMNFAQITKKDVMLVMGTQHSSVSTTEIANHLL
jgi:hypothetical protein